MPLVYKSVELTKGQNRKFQIIEGAIKNFATIGIENTTPASIAKACKISRPLVLHYFKDVKSIFEVAIVYIRAEFQQLAIDAISREKTTTNQLKAYVDSTMDWVEKYPHHVRVWLLFFYYCGINEKSRQLNSELVDMGHDRITALLEIGLKSKEFKFDHAIITAKIVQNIITGAIICAMTEVRSPRTKFLRRDTIKACLLAVGVSV
jgi:AcrR family transcriptional regulator